MCIETPDLRIRLGLSAWLSAETRLPETVTACIFARISGARISVSIAEESATIVQIQTGTIERTLLLLEIGGK